MVAEFAVLWQRQHVLAHHTAVFGWQGPGELGLEVTAHCQDDPGAGGRGRVSRRVELALFYDAKLANFGKEGRPEPIVGKFSQEMLAEMIGT